MIANSWDGGGWVWEWWPLGKLNSGVDAMLVDAWVIWVNSWDDGIPVGMGNLLIGGVVPIGVMGNPPFDDDDEQPLVIMPGNCGPPLCCPPCELPL